MTQPAPRSGPVSLLTRRLGPLPVWVWFLVFVLVLAAFILWRRRKSQNAGAAGSSSVYSAQNLTNQPSTLVPYTSDIFVNVQQPGATGPAGPEGPSGPSGPAGPAGTPTQPAAQPSGPPGVAASQIPFLNSNGTLSVGKGANLYDVANSVGISFAQLEALNQPWFRQNISWQSDPSHPSYKNPLAIQGRPYRIR